MLDGCGHGRPTSWQEGGGEPPFYELRDRLLTPPREENDLQTSFCSTTRAEKKKRSGKIASPLAKGVCSLAYSSLRSLLLGRGGKHRGRLLSAVEPFFRACRASAAGAMEQRRGAAASADRWRRRVSQHRRARLDPDNPLLRLLRPGSSSRFSASRRLHLRRPISSSNSNSIKDIPPPLLPLLPLLRASPMPRDPRRGGCRCRRRRTTSSS